MNDLIEKQVQLRVGRVLLFFKNLWHHLFQMPWWEMPWFYRYKVLPYFGMIHDIGVLLVCYRSCSQCWVPDRCACLNLVSVHLGAYSQVLYLKDKEQVDRNHFNWWSNLCSPHHVSWVMHGVNNNNFIWHIILSQCTSHYYPSLARILSRGIKEQLI
jgi:hypothetical protein